MCSASSMCKLIVSAKGPFSWGLSLQSSQSGVASSLMVCTRFTVTRLSEKSAFSTEHQILRLIIPVYTSRVKTVICETCTPMIYNQILKLQIAISTFTTAVLENISVHYEALLS